MAKKWTEDERMIAKALDKSNIPIELIARTLGRTVAAVRQRLQADNGLEVNAATPKERAAIIRILNSFMRKAKVDKPRLLNTIHPNIYWLHYTWNEHMARPHMKYVGQVLCWNRLEAAKRLAKMVDINRVNPLNDEELAIMRRAKRVILDSYARRDGMLYLTKQLLDTTHALAI